MIAAVDVGGTKIAVGLVDRGGRVLSRAEAPTQTLQNYSAGLAYLSGEFDRATALLDLALQSAAETG